MWACPAQHLRPHLLVPYNIYLSEKAFVMTLGDNPFATTVGGSAGNAV